MEAYKIITEMLSEKYKDNLTVDKLEIDADLYYQLEIETKMSMWDNHMRKKPKPPIKSEKQIITGFYSSTEIEYDHENQNYLQELEAWEKAGERLRKIEEHTNLIYYGFCGPVKLIRKE